jgi:hypothetical protein
MVESNKPLNTRPYVPSFLDLKSEQIADLVRDVELQQQGVVFYYAIDPYEIHDFCFPFLDERPTRYDLDRVADDQIALNEIIFRHPHPPILPTQYGEEMERILWFLRNRADRGYATLESFHRLIGRTGHSKVLDGSESEILSFIAKNMNVLLAALLGAFSSGTDRLDRVLVRIREGPGFPAVDSSTLTGILTSYEESPLAGEIAHELFKDARGKDDLQLANIRRAALLDAQVIDLLVFLNDELDLAWRQGRLSQPYVFLYFSSAPKTARLFKQEFMRLHLPNIRGSRYSFCRTRAQVFAANVFKDPKNYQATIADLHKLEAIVDSVRHLRDQHVALKGGHELRERAQELVANVKSRVETLRTQSTNFGLLANIAEYENLATGELSGSSDISKVFTKIYEKYAKTDWALERMRVSLQLMAVQTDFGSSITQNLTATDREMLREGRDVVTGVAQFLPILPSVSNQTYQSILDKVIAFYKQPAHQLASNLRSLLEAYNEFVTIGSRSPTDVLAYDEDPDHELVRCFLYLAFLKPEGDEKARRHARAMIRSHPEHAQEFRYVLCWAARRRKQYSEAHSEASIGINESKRTDPRFYHGRALAIFAWLFDETEKTRCPYTIGDAIEDIEMALERYKIAIADRRELIGACLNSLTYFHCLGESYGSYDLVLARERLLELKTYINKETWNPLYPEYLHTEAYLEYQEFKTMDVDPACTTERKINKLRSAKRDLGSAIRVYPKDAYRLLLNQVDLALKELDGHEA